MSVNRKIAIHNSGGRSGRLRAVASTAASRVQMAGMPGANMIGSCAEVHRMSGFIIHIVESHERIHMIKVCIDN